jgi:hypothetical protein
VIAAERIEVAARASAAVLGELAPGTSLLVDAAAAVRAGMRGRTEGLQRLALRRARVFYPHRRNEQRGAAIFRVYALAAHLLHETLAGDDFGLAQP